MNSSTLLLRQVNPSFVHNGRVTSQAFRPTTKDSGLLSTYDGDLITAEKAWTHFTNQLKFKSIGALAVAVAECVEQSLATRSDPDTFAEHALIDFNGFQKAQVENKAKKLCECARTRGWQFKLSDSE